MADSGRPTRRQRMRVAAIAEVKAAARELLTEGGPSRISLRAIARTMGLTPAAIYRYFPSLDALVASLRSDLFDEVRELLEAARDRTPGDDPLVRVGEMARAFRRWSIDHPAEFGLLFGPPLPGVNAEQAQPGAAQDPRFRFAATFLTEFTALWHQRPVNTPPVCLIEERLGRHLGPYTATHRDIPLPVLFILLSAWTRLYGLVAMEVFGHMDWAVTDAEILFEMELRNFARQLTGDQPAHW
jgi:AcrR family transcriptional regulator